MNALDLIKNGTLALKENKISSHRIDSEILLSSVLGKSREEILINLDEKINFDPEQFLSFLKPLQPRSYSISSSLKMHQNQVHLTISSVRWKEKERIHNGVCSTYLADMESPFSKIGVYISQNKFPKIFL